MRLALIALCIAVVAAAAPKEVEDFVEEGDEVEHALAAEVGNGLNQQQVHGRYGQLGTKFLASPHRLRYAPAKCIAKVSLLRQKFVAESKSRGGERGRRRGGRECVEREICVCSEKIK